MIFVRMLGCLETDVLFDIGWVGPAVRDAGMQTMPSPITHSGLFVEDIRNGQGPGLYHSRNVNADGSRISNFGVCGSMPIAYHRTPARACRLRLLPDVISAF